MKRKVFRTVRPSLDADIAAAALKEQGVDDPAPDIDAWIARMEDENKDFDATQAAKLEQDRHIAQVRVFKKWWEFWM